MDSRDAHFPMDESNLAHVESRGREKACPNFFKPAHRFGTKIVSRRTPHGMECFSPTLVQALGLNLMKPRNPSGRNSVWANSQSGPTIKWA